MEVKTLLWNSTTYNKYTGPSFAKVQWAISNKLKKYFLVNSIWKQFWDHSYMLPSFRQFPVFKNMYFAGQKFWIWL